MVRGLDQGMLGMCVDERRRVVVPSDLAYGRSGAGGGAVAGGDTIVYEVERVR